MVDAVFLEKVVRPLFSLEEAAVPPQTDVVRKLFFELRALEVGYGAG